MDLQHISAGDAPTARSEAPVCTYRSTDGGWDRHRHLVDETDIPLAARFYWIDCPDVSYLRWYLPGDPADPVAAGLFTELVQEAFDRIHAPAPTLAISPDLEWYQLTGMPTWLAVDAEHWADPPTGTVTAGLVSVTAWLEPERVDWELGNGDTVTCDGPGNVYDPQVPYRAQRPDCHYTYTTHPADHRGDPDAVSYAIAASVTYTAHYRIDGLPDAGPITATVGAISGPQTTADLEVREQRAIRTTSH